jgi:predicted TIM-barrel fold metal-dependent hydrolase
MFHAGTSIFPGARNKCGDPIHVDDVAVDFPELKIVLAHGGRLYGWTQLSSWWAAIPTFTSI